MCDINILREYSAILISLGCTLDTEVTVRNIISYSDSVDSISRDGPDSAIYIVHYKNLNNSIAAVFLVLWPERGVPFSLSSVLLSIRCSPKRGTLATPYPPGSATALYTHTLGGVDWEPPPRGPYWDLLANYTRHTY